MNTQEEKYNLYIPLLHTQWEELEIILINLNYVYP